MAIRLTAVEGEQTIELRPGASLVVGRAPTSDASVVDPTVSRRHAELVAGEGDVSVRDLGSSNGTYVNGARVAEARVAPGDVLRFGKVAFRVGETTPRDARQAVTTPLSASTIGARTVVRPVVRTGSTASVAGPRLVGGDADARRLRTLLDVSLQLARAASADALLDRIVDVCLHTFDFDRVAVLLGDTPEALAPRVARDRRGRRLDEMVPLSIARRAFEERAAILTDDAPLDQRFGGQSVVVQQVRSAICAPLLGSEGRVLGVIYVDNQALSHRFTDEDLEFVVAFSGIAGVAIENGEMAERIRREALVRTNFERFFSPGVAERIAGSEGALAGERRAVAVLFSDVRGFTPLSEALAPETTASLLNEYFTEMAECVFRHGGTLDKFLGDGLMALWGAPIPAPDDADRAVRAAVDMVKSLAALNERRTAAGRPPFSVGIGINYGEAFAGTIGSARRMEYTVIGDVVNTAARLCDSAEGGEILVSGSVRDALTEPAPLDPHAPLDLRGKSQPVPVYCVVPR